jgi:hypothetical protein
MTPTERAEQLYPDIKKRFLYELYGTERAVKRLIAAAIRDAVKAEREPGSLAASPKF